MKISTLYGVIVESCNGGQTMDSFMKERSAISRSKEIINHIKDSGRKGFKVFLSELDYDSYNNRLLTSSLVNDESELLFNN